MSVTAGVWWVNGGWVVIALNAVKINICVIAKVYPEKVVGKLGAASSATSHVRSAHVSE
jgi:hypothetical protein